MYVFVCFVCFYIPIDNKGGSKTSLPDDEISTTCKKKQVSDRVVLTPNQSDRVDNIISFKNIDEAPKTDHIENKANQRVSEGYSKKLPSIENFASKKEEKNLNNKISDSNVKYDPYFELVEQVSNQNTYEKFKPIDKEIDQDKNLGFEKVETKPIQNEIIKQKNLNFEVTETKDKKNIEIFQDTPKNQIYQDTPKREDTEESSIFNFEDTETKDIKNIEIYQDTPKNDIYQDTPNKVDSQESSIFLRRSRYSIGSNPSRSPSRSPQKVSKKSGVAVVGRNTDKKFTESDVEFSLGFEQSPVCANIAFMNEESMQDEMYLKNMNNNTVVDSVDPFYPHANFRRKYTICRDSSRSMSPRTPEKSKSPIKSISIDNNKNPNSAKKGLNFDLQTSAKKSNYSD